MEPLTQQTTNGFYVTMLTSNAYTLQDKTIIDKQIITAGGFVVKAQYLCSMQVDTIWYWSKHTQQNFISVPTRTIIHTCLEVNTETDFHAIPTSVCSSTQAKISISRQPICLTDYDYDYIL